jgi:hypothetical protein
MTVGTTAAFSRQRKPSLALIYRRQVGLNDALAVGRNIWMRN